MSPFKNMSVPDRVTMAKKKTERVVDHPLYLLELHENNAIIVYSGRLSSQIPTSYAANAFNLFQQALHQFEIVRLCALWDGADADKENIPTIIELIDHSEVIELIAQETLAHWAGGGPLTHVGPSEDDPQLRAEMERIQENFGQQQAQTARNQLRGVIDDVRIILKSPKA